MSSGGAARIGRIALRGARSLRAQGSRRTFSREVFFHAAERFTPTLTVDSGGLRVQVSTGDVGVGKTLFMGRDLESETLERALGELAGRTDPDPRRTSLVDVGANVGTTTLAALSRFGLSDAVCFEPLPENLSLLRQNVLANGFADRVRIVEAALSDEVGSAEFELAPGNPSDNRVRPSDGARAEDRFGEADWAVCTVPLTTFDVEVEAGRLDPSAVALVWIDAQGHEGHILRGASSLLGEGIPMVIEYWPYGLRRSGGSEILDEIVGRSFRTVLDLEAPQNNRALEVPPRALSSLEPHLPPPAKTDLLLIP